MGHIRCPQSHNTGVEEYEPSVPDPITQAAQQTFGVRYLFPWQRLVIANILDAVASADAARAVPAGAAPPECERSVWARQIVLLPTGAGKSLCFLVPAALFDRPTLVIYPLLALMSDQMRRIDASGLGAVAFRGGQSAEERSENFRRLDAGAKLILANPEVFLSDALVERLAQYQIVHAAIDEAHCVAEWGDSFRPAYLRLREIIDRLGIPVVTAFTATASEPVLRHVSDALFGGEAHVVRSDSDRANIRYRVHYAYAKQKAALCCAAAATKPLLAFCGTRQGAESAARLFAEYFGRERVRFYHAGLTRAEKTVVEAWFFPRDDALLCATCAFGMGVDKANVRTVIHLDPPLTAEAYVQEAGRGGRDGDAAEAILLWSSADSRRAAAFPAGSRERVLADFAERGTCRRQTLLDALGGERAACSGCDVCDGTAETSARDADEVLAFFRKTGRRYTCAEAAGILYDRANARSRAAFDRGLWERQDFKRLIDQLIAEKRLIPGGLFSKGRIIRVHGKTVQD
jgi:ATP-dependent DNA helicase RecQ